MDLKSFFKMRNAMMIVGFIMMIIIVGMAIFAPYVAPHDPLRTNPRAKLLPMSKEHFFGTDQFGRDTFSRIIFGARYSLFIGVLAILISMVTGGFVGLIGGYYAETKIAKLIVWITDILMAFPTLILGAIVAMLFGPGILNTVIAISIAFFPRFIRFARAGALSIREETYIMAAKGLGMSEARLLFLHLVPNIISPIIVMAVVWTSAAISLEVALSFIGLGVPPPTPSWGVILQGNLRYFRMDPVSVLWPCFAVAWTVQALNMIGDRFRDIMDPTMT